MENFLSNINIGDIKMALSIELQAEKAHEKFLPQGRSLNIPDGKIAEVKQSAVLLLIISHEKELLLCLTQRSSKLKHHPGQISFPGGSMNHDENTSEITALREMNEEIGIAPGEVSICGKLSELYIPASNFLIHPVVGYLEKMPVFKVNKNEVEQVLLLPLKKFFDKKNVIDTQVLSHAKHIVAPGYSIEGHFIWGATAMIIAEFTEQLTTFYHRLE